MSIKLTDRQAEVIVEFLKRIQLKGQEVPAYVNVVNALQTNKKEKKQAKNSK